MNFAGAESSEDVAAGVLSFSHDGVGHEMAWQCVRDLRRNFRGYDWGSNGPGIITRLLKRVCSTEDVSLLCSFFMYVWCLKPSLYCNTRAFTSVLAYGMERMIGFGRIE